MVRLKDEGNRLFGRKEYQKAVEAYDRALRVASADAKEELALLHSNKAACFMILQRWREGLSLLGRQWGGSIYAIPLSWYGVQVQGGC